MRFIFILFVLISSLAQGQIKRGRPDLSKTTIKNNTLSRSGTMDKFSSMNLSNADSIKLKKVITAVGDTVAHISEYRIFNEVNGTSTVDTLLNIRKQYAFNYLRKDHFGLLTFGNDGLTYQSLDPNFVTYNNVINFGFKARRFSYLNKEDINYYSVPTPFSELFYRSATDKGQNLDALIALNISEQFNVFLGYRGLRSQGKYRSQMASNGNFRFGSSYFTKNKRYQFKNHITFQDITNEENGGMFNVAEFESSDAPFDNRLQITNQFADAITQFKGIRTYLDHSFQFNKSETNKALIRHQFTYEYFSNLYQQQNYKPFQNRTAYLGEAFSTGIHDKVRHKRFENTVDLAFDSKAIGLFAVGVGAYNFIHEYQSIIFDENANKIPNRLKDDLITIGGSYVLNSKHVLADVVFKQAVIGRSMTDLNINAAFNVNERYGIEATYRLESKIPDYTYQFFQSDYIGLNWLTNFNNEKINTLSAKINTPFLHLFARYQMIDDKLYFSNDATTFDSNGRATQLLVSPKQHNGLINYFMLKAQKEFKYKKWALDNTVMFQKVVQENSILNVPKFVTRNTLYYSDYVFDKALYFQTGIIFNYFTKYYANEYHPVLGDFVVQDRVKVGGYPMFDFFINAKIKTAQIYINVEHFNSQFTGYNYYNTPTYAFRDLTFRLGVKWNFFN